MKTLGLHDFELPLDAFLPREKAPVASWVGDTIYLDARTTPIPGFYNHDHFPYARAVFECFGNPEVETIIMSWATQTGKTTALTSIVGWIGDNDPAACMIATANEKLAQKNYTRILLPAMERVESLRKRMPSKTRRRWQIVDLGDMWVFYAWPGSKATVSDTPIKYLLMNEISLWKAPKGKEGDPVRMAMDRTKAFEDAGRKILIEGKPTIEGECQLTSMLEASRKHELYVPCPKCGEFQRLYKGKDGIPGGVKWVCDYDSKDAVQQAMDTVHWECEKCLEKHGDDARFRAIHRSIWVPDGQTVDKGGKLHGAPKRGPKQCGFRLPTFASPLVKMSGFAQEWMTARNNPAELQAVVNGWLAETWKRKKKKTSKDELENNRGLYLTGKVPTECLVLVMTVDVQQASFYFVVRAWGWLGNSWKITSGQLDSWAAVQSMRELSWEGKDGELHRIGITICDSAYQKRENEVYDWCAKHGAIPYRGEHQYQQTAMVRIAELPTHGIQIWHTDAGQIRDQFYFTRLPKRADVPGYWCFPKDARPEYLRALTSWERKEKKIGEKTVMRWESTSPEYEHLADCEFMQEAFAFVYQMQDRRPPPPKAVQANQEVDPTHRPWLVTQRR